MDFDFIYSDSEIIAINKPSGLLTIPDGYQLQLPCAIDLLRKTYGPLWVVHRLDKETSGILIFAKNPRAHKILNDQFQNRQVEKYYHAIVTGNPDWEMIEIKLPLFVDGDRKHRTVVNLDKGKFAQTDFKVLEKYPGYTLIEAHPHTGYTHQIRAHLSLAGFPIINDYLYARLANSQNDLIPRLGLHALRISFIHPNTSQWISLDAPYPEDMQQALQTLRT